MVSNKPPIRPPYSHIVRMIQRNQIRSRLKEQRLSTASQADELIELSLDAQERINALEKYPHLKESVSINNSGILVTTQRGSMKFLFHHREGNVYYEDDDKNFSKGQLVALVELFGSNPGPYLEILGLKNATKRDIAPKYQSNFYWSSSRNPEWSDLIWGLYLTSDEVTVRSMSNQDKHSSLVG